MPVEHDAAQDGPAPIPELSLEQAVDLFRLSPQECESLAIARDILLLGADELLSEHYRRLKLLPDAPKLLDSEEKIERLKLGVANWLKTEVLEPATEFDASERLTKLGSIHVRIGVPLSYIVAAFGTLEGLCLEALNSSPQLAEMGIETTANVRSAFHKRLAREQLGFVAAYSASTAQLNTDRQTTMEATIASRSDSIKSTVSLSQTIAGETSEQQIFHVLADHIVQTFDPTLIEITMFVAEGTAEPALVIRNGAVSDLPDSEAAKTVQRDPSLCRAARTAQPFVVADVATALVTCPYQPSGMTSGSYCCLPIASGPTLLGWLHVTHETPNFFSQATVEVLTIYGRLVGTAITSLRLMQENKRQATVDSLTGLHNRRYFEDVLAKEQVLLDRRPSPCTILIVDIDKFKTINDTWGHDTGDQVLVVLSNVLRECTRKADEVARLGGDEIIMLLRNCDTNQARQVADKILQQVAAAELPLEAGAEASLHVSIGLAGCPEHTPALAEAWQLADAALLEAKEAGRNQVVLHAGPGRQRLSA
ncbi:hypothetical protein LCGC14_0494640 [marine sediment metagenome]|uniref:Diguanylate cyclase DosC n=1 Tax=marine sediment metagenome TaxID=412755 RepID=A0A0F9VE94_9ZZZZ